MHPDNSWYVIGGRQRPMAHFDQEWHGYRKGVVLRVTPATGSVESVVEYESPPEVCPPEKPSILFKAGSIKDEILYVCTQTEVIGYSLPSFEQVAYLSLPLFNDLHHVVRTSRDTYLIAITGLDMVVEVADDGEVLQEWSTVETDPWDRFSRQIDYRLVSTTKPHAAHPNYVFGIGHDTWVTRFNQRDAINLSRPGEEIPLGGEGPHDGMVFGDSVYFTTVDGRIVIADVAAKDAPRVVDLNEINQIDRQLGWLRGLHTVSEDVVVVGFSRLRPSAVRENLQWIKHRLGKRMAPGGLPSRIACYDLTRRSLLWELNVEDHGLNAIFSIHPVDE